MHVEVVAEGVETKVQQSVLQQMQCGHYQGFLCAPGLPAPEFRALLAATQPVQAQAARKQTQP
jgi:EAL domain-containing protein (putative c-di-GMP-specific phosphodiesterase class I)